MKYISLFIWCSWLAAGMEKPSTTSGRSTHKRSEHITTLVALTEDIIAQRKDLNVPIKEGEFAGYTLLTAAAQHRAYKKILKRALAAGANPDMPDGHTRTPIQVAVQELCTSAFKRLAKVQASIISHGLVPEICNRLHDTLNIKKAMKRIAMLECLLNSAQTPAIKKQLANEPDEHENTALYHLLWALDPFKNSEHIQRIYTEPQRAIFYMQRKKMICILLDAGLEVGHKNREGLTAIENINAHAHLKDDQLMGFLMEQVQNSTKTP